MTIKIDKKIPVPTKITTKYPFGDMAVGDSFVVSTALRSSVYGASASWARQHNPDAKFTTRKEGDETRIWRVK